MVHTCPLSRLLRFCDSTELEICPILDPSKSEHDHTAIASLILSSLLCKSRDFTQYEIPAHTEIQNLPKDLVSVSILENYKGVFLQSSNQPLMRAAVKLKNCNLELKKKKLQFRLTLIDSPLLSLCS